MQFFFPIFPNFAGIFAAYQKAVVRFTFYVLPYAIITHGKHFVKDSRS
jgi:hypothetical protein